MKKIYNTPEVKVLKIQTVNMIAASVDADLSSAQEFDEIDILSGSRSIEDMMGLGF